MPDATRVWPVGTRRQLLFDRRFVESSSGLQFTLNPPLERRPVNLPRPNGLHHVNDLDVHIWQAKQRLDGFVSVDAGSDDGWLVTPPIAFEGSRLQLNIDCGAMGEAWVELQDEAGKPLPGYAFEDAVSVDRNGVAQEVWWQTGPDVGSLSGRPVRLKLRMRSAKLYAFQFVKAG